MAEQTEELDHPRTNLFVAKSSDPKMLHKQPASTNISVPNQEVSANKNVQTPLSQILKKRWKTQMTFFSITTLKFL